MKAILNAMRLQAQRQASARRDTTVGTITSYDPALFAVRVQLQAEGILTGWLPLCSPWIGNGWGLFAAPSVGDMVTVHFFGGELEAGFVEGRLFNDVDRPLSVPSGEFWLVHKSGSFLKFTDDGNVSVNSAADLVATVGGNLSASVSGNATASITGNLHATAATAKITAPTTIEGTLHVTGAITSDAGITAATDVADQGGAKTMAGMRTAHNAHKGHGTPGTGNVPDTLM
jgi:phage baseplate assembly protein V